jgi:hypothetical protein
VIPASVRQPLQTVAPTVITVSVALTIVNVVSTLINHIAKLFTSVLNTRLIAWSEHNDVITDAQMGFKPGYSTTDTICVLHSIISKYVHDKKRLYCYFIDYQKAFYSINHDKLWYRLVKSGITDKLLTLLKSMFQFSV